MLNRKRSFKISLLAFILAFITTSTIFFIGPIVCSRNEFGNCSYASSFITVVSAYVIAGILLITSLIFLILGLSGKRK